MAVDEVDRVEERLGQEVEPAPVHRIVEAGDVAVQLVTIEHVHFLRAGEHAAGGCRVAAGGQVFGVGGDVADLEAVRTVVEHVVPGGPGLRLLVRHQRGQPVLVGEAGPAAATRVVVADVAVLGGGRFHRAVAHVVQLVVEHAQHALEHVQPGRGWQVVAMNALPGPQLHCRGAGVVHALPHGEHVVGVDAQLETVGKAGAIVPGEGDRMGCGDCGAGGGPDSVAVRRLHPVRRGPAELHVARLRVERRLQHPHQRRGLRHRLVVVAQPQVIEPCAEQADGAGHPRTVDLDARYLAGVHRGGGGPRAPARGRAAPG